MTIDEMYEELERLPLPLLEALSGALIYPAFALNLRRIIGEKQLARREESGREDALLDTFDGAGNE